MGVTYEPNVVRETAGSNTLLKCDPAKHQRGPTPAYGPELDWDCPKDLLGPYQGCLEAWQVSRQVNAPKNQGPELVERI